MSRGRDQFAKFKPVINIMVKFVKLMPFKIRVRCFEMLRNKKGKSGMLLRYVFLKTLAKQCGDNIAIFPNVYLLNPQNLVIGNNVSIQPMCYIECGYKEGIEIGDDVAIAHSVTIIATNHGFDNPNMTIKDHPLVESKITIGDDVWFGCKATIVAGTNIGTRCVIAANAVITKDVDSNSLVGGIPAKLIRKLDAPLKIRGGGHYLAVKPNHAHDLLEVVA